MEAWIRFANLQLPHRQANALLERFGTPQQLFDTAPRDVIDAQVIPDKVALRIHDPSYLATNSQLAYARSAGVEIVPLTHDEFPRNLKELPDLPPVLFVRGRLDEKDQFSVAIVGSRLATPYGRTVTAKLSRDLAAAGLAIVSGGAIGIDTAAHRATVEAGGRHDRSNRMWSGCRLSARESFVRTDRA